MTEKTVTQEEKDLAEVVIERAVPENAEEILKLKKAAWLQTYPNQDAGVTEEDIHKKLSDEDIEVAIPHWQSAIAKENDGSDRMTFVAKLNGKVIGYTQPCIEDGKRKLGAMYVLPTAQGMGAGGRLIRQALQWHGPGDDIYASVVSYNENAIKFYEHFGFQRTGKSLPEEFDKEKNIKLLPEIEMVHRSN